MTVLTSKGKEFDISWMWGPVGYSKDVMLQMKDSRKLSEIAIDFEGCELYQRKDELEGDMTFEGYVDLIAIVRPNRNTDDVQITLSRSNSES